MISDDDICVTTMLMMMIMQMMKMENEDGDDDDNEDDDEDDDDGDDDDDDATFAILCYSDRARLLACQSVSCPRAPQGAMRSSSSSCPSSSSARACSSSCRRLPPSGEYGPSQLPRITRRAYIRKHSRNRDRLRVEKAIPPCGIFNLDLML